MNLLKILEELVSIDTSENKRENVAKSFDLIDAYLSPLGLKRTDYDNNEILSCVWSFDRADLKPDIILSAHIDVVPGEPKMFLMKNDGKRVYGRGVSDMKFAIASFIVALDKLHQESKMPKNIAVMITSDEEMGGMDGVNNLVNSVGYRPKVVIMPDGGDDFSMTCESKGVLHMKITTKGKAGHAAYPWNGISANDKLVEILTKLRQKYPTPTKEVWENTLNIGIISGGKQTNQISDEAMCKLDFRLIPGTDFDKVISEVKTISSNAMVEVLVEASPFWVDSKNRYVQEWIKVLESKLGKQVQLIKEHGAADGRFFSPHNIPVLISKSVGGGEHAIDEWTDIKSFEMFTECIYEFLNSSR